MVDVNILMTADELKKKDINEIQSIIDSVNSHLLGINTQLLLHRDLNKNSILYNFNNDFPAIEGVQLEEIQTCILHKILFILIEKGYTAKYIIPQNKSIIQLMIQWECTLDRNTINKYRSELKDYIINPKTDRSKTNTKN